MQQHIWRHKANPWEPADYDDDVVYAVRMVHAGTASAGQQKLFWSWLMHACGEDDWAYRPEAHGGQSGRDVALGKQFPAKQLKKMLNPLMNPKKVDDPSVNVGPKRPKRKKR